MTLVVGREMRVLWRCAGSGGGGTIEGIGCGDFGTFLFAAFGFFAGFALAASRACALLCVCVET